MGIHAIEPLLLVPLIQSTLHSAIENVDSSAAQLIKRNMDFQFTMIPVVDGTTEVFRVFSQVIREMKDIDCRDVGSLQTMNVCEGGRSSSAQGLDVFSPVFITVVFIAISALFFNLNLTF